MYRMGGISGIRVFTASLRAVWAADGRRDVSACQRDFPGRYWDGRYKVICRDGKLHGEREHSGRYFFDRHGIRGLQRGYAALKKGKIEGGNTICTVYIDRHGPDNGAWYVMYV